MFVCFFVIIVDVLLFWGSRSLCFVCFGAGVEGRLFVCLSFRVSWEETSGF